MYVSYSQFIYAVYQFSISSFIIISHSHCQIYHCSIGKLCFNCIKITYCTIAHTVKISVVESHNQSLYVAMDYEVPVSIQQAPVSDYEVPVSSNPSYSDHVPLSTNNNQLLATPVTTNPSYQPVELETEYYDTFDANKICTKSNTSYLPVDLKTTTTTVSPSVHIKRTNKRIRSYFNEELTNWEYILAALATLTVLITVTAISLALIIIFKGEMGAQSLNDVSTLTITQSPPTTAAFSVNPLDSCQCTVNQTDDLKLSSSYLSQLLSTKNMINLLKEERNMSTSDVLKQLKSYTYQVEIINESLQSLITESKKPKIPTLTGLNLTSSITINHGDCVDELWKCKQVDELNFHSDTIVNIGLCTTVYSPYANDTHIVVGASCNILPVLPKPVFSVILIKGNADSRYVSGLQLLKQSTIACRCFNENVQQASCHAYLKKCSYQQDVSQNGSLSISS
ncbi:PREDICTED: uncharacterized protein LOC109584162 [Amphimedon queenslandica]|uniref:Uncharacterized protein n=1 Tax=Amphimedon queenslandica TaxID=400682 RepID=A0AAN0JEZ1_AMPQE|nr:PREDICTED: uncharacterized protein LOC109584162 [Amphimedon queenslandica]|eukprot:XP_019855337.1 PREDICTED: uncharacterized protein LOC109584162 [Amphimedon queenslandica]